MGVAVRSRMPVMSTATTPNSTFSMPNLRASTGASSETNPKQMTGMVVRRPAVAAVMPVSRAMVSSSGDTESSGARKVSPTRTTVRAR